MTAGPARGGPPGAAASGRLGILGGTFDPIHFGHLDAAAAARAAMGLDQIVFIPAHDPPHRPIDPRASALHRFALVSLAIDGVDGYRVSDMELRRDGPSYTVTTLRSLHADGWLPSQLYFVLGADAFAEIGTWYAFPEVLDCANFVVISRPGAPEVGRDVPNGIGGRPAEYVGRDATRPGEDVGRDATRPGEDVGRNATRAGEDVGRDATRAGEDVGRDAKRPGVADSETHHAAGLAESASTRIYHVEARTRDVSSTTIRARLAAGESIADLVPAAVARHIGANQLYGAADVTHG